MTFLPSFSPGNWRKTTASILKTHLGAQELEWEYGARSGGFSLELAAQELTFHHGILHVVEVTNVLPKL